MKELKIGGIYKIKSLYRGNTIDEVIIEELQPHSPNSRNVFYKFVNGSGSGRMREEWFVESIVLEEKGVVK